MSFLRSSSRAEDLQSGALYYAARHGETGAMLEIEINLTGGLAAFVDAPISKVSDLCPGSA